MSPFAALRRDAAMGEAGVYRERPAHRRRDVAVLGRRPRLVGGDARPLAPVLLQCRNGRVVVLLASALNVPFLGPFEKRISFNAKMGRVNMQRELCNQWFAG